jgi:hypothetical protein
LEGTLSDFNQNGGIDKFKSDLSLTLGINDSYFTIIEVFEGSVGVIYDLTADSDLST